MDPWPRSWVKALSCGVGLVSEPPYAAGVALKRKKTKKKKKKKEGTLGGYMRNYTTPPVLELKELGGGKVRFSKRNSNKEFDMLTYTHVILVGITCII